MQPAYDADDLLRSQMEVHGLQRAPPKTVEELIKAKKTVSDLCKFSTQIGRLATRQGFPLELVFQCLLGIGVGSEVNFDKQHRQGDVPMHQAKVLNREAANSIAPKLKAEVPAAELDDLVRRSGVMRTFLRMKVEDGNDLSMARRALTLGDEYFNKIEALASGDPQVMWALYTADDAAAVHSIVRGGSDADSGESAEAPQAALKPMPKNLPHGIQLECTAALMKNTEPVPKRLAALATILRWIREAPVDQISSEMVEIHLSLRKALDVQLAEKRSAITRAACDIVSALAVLASGGHYTIPEIKETTSSWLSVLLKQVHVTVGAIAEATDMTVRDVAAASQGAAFFFSAVSAVLVKATQPELQRKCVGYLLIGLVTSTNDTAAKVASVASAVDAMLRSSNDGIRRVARAFGIVCEIQCPSCRLPSWDDRCEKSASDERPTVVALLNKGVAAVEVGVLRYPTASNVARESDSPKKAAVLPARSSSPFVPAATPPAHTPLARPGALPALANRPTVATPSTLEDSPTNLPTHVVRPQPRPAPVTLRDANTFERTPVARPTSLCHTKLSEPVARPASGAGIPLSLGALDLHTPDHATRTEADLLSSLKAKRRLSRDGPRMYQAPTE